MINQDESQSHETVARFKREARASGGIDSQHVVQVLDTGVDPRTGSPYLVLELLDGEDLRQVVDRQTLRCDVVLKIIAQACSGLAKAHREGIIHRDIKSANLFLARREEHEIVVKLLDFGIAKLRPEALPGSNRAKLTRSGSLLGSPLYMSPEQVTGSRELDVRSDIFSLGVKMYEALSGVTPNQEQTNLGALVVAIASGRGVPLKERVPALPDAVVAIVEKALGLEPEDRYASAGEMQAAIAALSPGGFALDVSILAGVSPLGRTKPVAQATVPLVGGGRALAFAPTAPNAATAPLREPGASTPAFGRTAPLSLPPTRRRRFPMAAAVLLALAVAAMGVRFLVRETAPSTPSAARRDPPTPSLEGSSAVAAPAGGTAPALVEVDASVRVAPEPPLSVVASITPKPRKRPPKPSCSPDFYLDAGVKIFKPECFPEHPPNP